MDKIFKKGKNNKGVSVLSRFYKSIGGMYLSVLSKEDIEKFRNDSISCQPFCGRSELLKDVSLNQIIDEGIEIMSRDGFRISDAFSEEKGKVYCKK